MNWKNILFENLWFLSGTNSVRFLHKHNIHFWDAWIYNKEFLPSAYGRHWRAFPAIAHNGVSEEHNFDQFECLINQIKTNPFSRRLVLTNWYPPTCMSDKLPPCHLISIFNVQMIDGEPVLNLHLTQRSCDIAVGLPYNIAGYAFLLSLVGHLTDMKVGQFAHSIVDAHVYINHKEGLKGQLEREPKQLSKIKIDSELKTIADLNELIKNGTTDDIMNCFKITEYTSHPFIKFEVAV